MTDDEVHDALRALLRAPNDVFEVEMSRLLDSLGSDFHLLYRTHRFIADAIPKAAARYQPRMNRISEQVLGRLRDTAANECAVGNIAEEVCLLEARRCDLDARIDGLKALLACMLGPSIERMAGPHGIKIGAVAHTLKVPKPGNVPPAFMARQPDRKAILKHFHETGEVLPGTSVETRRPSVRVWKL